MTGTPPFECDPECPAPGHHGQAVTRAPGAIPEPVKSEPEAEAEAGAG